MVKYANMGGWPLNKYVSSAPLPAPCQACSPHRANPPEGGSDSELCSPLRLSSEGGEGDKRQEVAHTDHFPHRKDLAGVSGSAQRPFGSSWDPARMLENKLLVFKDFILLIYF